MCFMKTCKIKKGEGMRFLPLPAGRRVSRSLSNQKNLIKHLNVFIDGWWVVIEKFDFLCGFLNLIEDKNGHKSESEIFMEVELKMRTTEMLIGVHLMQLVVATTFFVQCFFRRHLFASRWRLFHSTRQSRLAEGEHRFHQMSPTKMLSIGDVRCAGEQQNRKEYGEKFLHF